MTPTPRILYTDLDGTLFGQGGSPFRTATGDFTLAGARALELCHQQGVELALVSGRSLAMLQEDARVLGAASIIGEAGCVIVRDSGRTTLRNCGPFGNVEGMSVFDEIAATGAPGLLLDNYAGALTYHSPWSQSHAYSHLMRGYINTADADMLLEKHGHHELKVVDNGIIEDRGFGLNVGELHAYHIIPRAAGKGSAIRLHLEVSGLGRGDAFACGDSAQDLEMANEVGKLYLMSNAISNGLTESEIARDNDNVVVAGAPMVEGFLLAVRDALGVEA